MEENKKALKESHINNFIISENSSINNDDMPEILNDILSLYIKRFINLSDKFILNILLVLIAHMITSKRIVLREVAHTIIPNWYSIILAPSGYGKDQLIKTLNYEIFKNFRDWFKQQAKLQKEYQEKEIEKQANEKFSEIKQEKLKQHFIVEEKEFTHQAEAREYRESQEIINNTHHRCACI